MCSVMPSGHPSPLDEVDHQDHDGDDEQDMDEAAHRVRGDHPESPEDQKDHEDCPEHGISFLPSFILSRSDRSVAGTDSRRARSGVMEVGREGQRLWAGLLCPGHDAISLPGRSGARPAVPAPRPGTYWRSGWKSVRAPGCDRGVPSSFYAAFGNYRSRGIERFGRALTSTLSCWPVACR